MALLDDHVSFVRAPGAHEFGPRNIPDGTLSTLAVGLGADETTLTVQPGAGATFPSPPFFATLDAAGLVETVRVTGRAGNVFTVTREQPERVWSAGVRFQKRTLINMRFARCTVASPTLWAKSTVVLDAAATAGATTITAKPLYAHLSSGDVLGFAGGVNVTLTAAAAQSPDVPNPPPVPLSVQALPSSLPAGAVARGTEIAAQLWIAGDGGPPVGSGGMGHVSDDAFALFQGGTPAADLIAQGKLQFGAQGGRHTVRGADMIEVLMRCPVQPGINRVVTGVLGVRGGTFITERTIEVV